MTLPAVSTRSPRADLHPAAGRAPVAGHPQSERFPPGVRRKSEAARAPRNPWARSSLSTSKSSRATLHASTGERWTPRQRRLTSARPWRPEHRTAWRPARAVQRRRTGAEGSSAKVVAHSSQDPSNLLGVDVLPRGHEKTMNGLEALGESASSTNRNSANVKRCPRSRH